MKLNEHEITKMWANQCIHNMSGSNMELVGTSSASQNQDAFTRREVRKHIAASNQH